MLCDALLRADGTVDLFLDLDKLDNAVRDHLGEGVRLHETARFLPMLAEAGLSRVGLEKSSAPVIVETTLRDAGAEIIWTRDPCILPKARKNPAEQAGSRSAHLRDGAAMARFLCWLDRKSPSGELKEIKVAKRLEKYRHETGQLHDISFDTISAYGPNGAQPHYRVSRETNRTLEPGSLFLIDSGGQYPDGTTDITRVVAVGEPRDDHRRAFTLVLKGMIAVSRARFPKGTTGVQIDTLARAALWQAGFDFDHGTGHGVGAFLGVHEGPASLSKRGTVPLEPGMILSNEPGYYKEGDFGIRIENLLLVTPPAIPEGGEREMMAFETLTLTPIDLRLVDPALMRPDEIAWLDAYHERVYGALYPLVDEDTRDWLEQATAALA
jgi:Xaa-Pro aminopeptidase